MKKGSKQTLHSQKMLGLIMVSASSMGLTRLQLAEEDGSVSNGAHG